jgi:hypothetical protein
MIGIPEIPDQPISFTEMGALMDSYDGRTTAVNSSPGGTKASKERLRWQQMEGRAEEDYKRTEEEYNCLLHELISGSPR